VIIHTYGELRVTAYMCITVSKLAPTDLGWGHGALGKESWKTGVWNWKESWWQKMKKKKERRRGASSAGLLALLLVPLVVSTPRLSSWLAEFSFHL
jgi:hypothetical protein